MISGIFLKNPFALKDKTNGELMCELDITESSCTNENKVISDSYSMIKRSFLDDSYFCDSYSLSTLEGFEATLEIYKTVQDAIPGFLKTINFGNNSFLLVWPRFMDDFFEDEKYKKVLDELTRISGWCYKYKDKYLDYSTSVKEVIKSYFDMCVCYPGKK